MRRPDLKILAAVIFLGTAYCQPAASEIVDKIAVVVNEEIILDSEIERALIPFFHQYRTMYQGNDLLSRLEDVRRKIVEQLIDEKILLSEAKRLNIEVTDEEIEAKISESADRFGSRTAFEKALAEQRMTVKDLKSKYNEQIMVRKLIGQKAGSSVLVTPLDINNYYRDNAAEFVVPEEVKVRNILVRAGGDDDKAESLALDILARARAGEDFSEMARTYSTGPGAAEGGLMGYLKRGELMPEIEDGVFRLKEGEVSDIIKTGLGYHIFKVDEKREQKVLPLPEVRKDIEEAIFKQRANAKIKNWVADLKKNAYIAFK